MKLRLSHSNKISTKLISFFPILKASLEDIEGTAFEMQKENPLVEVKSSKFISISNYLHNSSSDIIESLTTNEDSFYDSLIFQIENSVLFPTKKSKLIANEIVKDIDLQGYFSGSEEEIADILNVSIEEVQKIRDRFRYLSPSGVGAKNREESFLFQLDNIENIKDEIYKLAKEMIINFKYIENYQEEKNFYEALKIIKDFKLSPTLDIQKNEYVLPDIIILRNENNLEVKLNEEYYPIIEIKDSKLDKEYSKQKLKEAKNLIDALEMRKATLYKIALMIVELQYDFFFGGAMKPMKLSNIAEELDFATSTISRAISNKYLMCDKGILPLKQFFSTALNEDVSSNQIKEEIKSLIESEDRKKPLNDEKITDFIQEKLNIKIVRRTISKYRESLNIPTSRQRKRAYKLMDK